MGGPFFRFVALPNCNQNLASKKCRKKCENRGFWPPKALPKTRPKCLQNQCSNKHAIFHGFLLEFCLFRYLRFLENHGFLYENHYFEVFTKIMLIAFGMHFRVKKFTKNLKKRRPDPSEIDAENVLFFNIDFFGFRPRFWRVFALQLGGKLAALPLKD